MTPLFSYFRGEPPAGPGPGPGAGPATSAEGVSPPASPFLPWFCGFLVIAGALATFYAADTGYLFSPFSDAHDWVVQALAVEAKGDWLDYLWRPHANQRIPLARAVAALDLAWTREAIPTFLVAGWLALLTGVCWLLAVVRQARIPAAVATWLGCFAGLLILNVAVAEDLAFPVFSVYPMVTGPALAAFACLALADARRFVSPTFLLALAFAVVASAGNAAGLAVWPALVAAALLQRRPLPQVAVLLVLGAAVIALFEMGLPAPAPAGAADAQILAPSHIWKTIQYFAVYGALPWARTNHPGVPSALFGLAVEAAAVVAAWRTGRGEGRYAVVQKLGAGLVIFGLATAALAAVGRVDELPEPVVPIRYFPFSALVQVGLLLCCAPLLERFLARRRATAALVAVGLILVALQVYGAARFGRTSTAIKAAGAAFDRGDRTPEVVRFVYPDPARAAAIRARLAQRRARD